MFFLGHMSFAIPVITERSYILTHAGRLRAAVLMRTRASRYSLRITARVSRLFTHFHALTEGFSWHDRSLTWVAIGYYSQANVSFTYLFIKINFDFCKSLQ